MDGFDLLYLAGLGTVTGYLLVGRVPSVLHTPLLAGASLVHGIVLIGGIIALSSADGFLGRLFGMLAVAFASANVVGGFLVTDRLLMLFERSTRRPERAEPADPVDATSMGRRSSSDASSDGVER